MDSLSSSLLFVFGNDAVFSRPEKRPYIWPFIEKSHLRPENQAYLWPSLAKVKILGLNAPGCLYFHPSKPRFSWTELSTEGFAKIQENEVTDYTAYRMSSSERNDSDNSEYHDIIKVTITIFEARQTIKSQRTRPRYS